MKPNTPRTATQKLPRTLIVHATNCHALNRLGQLRTQQSEEEEITQLTRAISLNPLALISVKIKRPHPAHLISTGKVEEIKKIITTKKIQLVIFNAPLSPGQQQNLEKIWQVKILDRTGLILEIFGERAHTKEARLQTDLAQLIYQKGRLVRSWTHLERQRGGAGFMGGPGERQIESDRRQIATRIHHIKKQLNAVRKRRHLMRQGRKKTNYPILALVGYTNAGKSTLFNRLTRSTRPARNMLFDTLDPTMRIVHLPHNTKIILSDTVGFIANLPHNLIAAFRATLEEVNHADMIIHLRDFSHKDSLAQKYDVEKILAELNANQPIIEVLNKIDQTPPPAYGNQLAISAKTGEGIPALLNHIQKLIAQQQKQQSFTILLTPNQTQAQAFLYQKGKIIDQHQHKKGLALKVLLPPSALGMFKKRFASIRLSPLPN